MSESELTDKEVVLSLFSRALDDLFDCKIAGYLANNIRGHEDHPIIKDLVIKHLIELDNELHGRILI